MPPNADLSNEQRERLIARLRTVAAEHRRIGRPDIAADFLKLADNIAAGKAAPARATKMRNAGTPAVASRGGKDRFEGRLKKIAKQKPKSHGGT